MQFPNLQHFLQMRPVLGCDVSPCTLILHTLFKPFSHFRNAKTCSKRKLPGRQLVVCNYLLVSHDQSFYRYSRIRVWVEISVLTCSVFVCNHPIAAFFFAPRCRVPPHFTPQKKKTKKTNEKWVRAK